MAAGERSGTPVRRVGQIETEPGLRLVDADGTPLSLRLHGWDHFA
jgi:thiamine-monophosphate kinase